MKKLLFFLSLSLIIVSCAKKDSNKGSSNVEEKKVLRFYSWAEYMDLEVIEMFKKEFNVDVQIDNFATNEEAIAKLEQQVELTGSPSYDVFMPSDYYVEYLRKKDMLEKIDIQQMPNVKGNILDHLINPDDPKGEYAVPYTWGTVGILYNKDKIKEKVDSWKFILEPQEKYKGQIMSIDSPKELVGVTLKYLGYPFNSTKKEELEKAGAILKKQSPYVLTYNGDLIQENMANNEAIMALTWSAEAGYAMEKNPSLAYVIPKEGTNIYMDEFVILKGANKELAQKFIDFFYRDDIQLKNKEYMNMAIPSKSALNKLTQEEKEDKRLYPSQELIKKLDPNKYSDNKTMEIINKIYTDIRS